MSNMPATVRAAFDANPAAHLASETRTWGHAYGKAKYSGRCGLTGTYIVANLTAIRRVVVWTRSGKCYDGWASNDGLGKLGFVGGQVVMSSWRRASGAVVAKAIENGATWIEVLKDDGSTTAYHFGDYDGKWHRGHQARMTAAQLCSSLRRSGSIGFARWGTAETAPL